MRISKSPKRVLYLSGNQLTAYHWSKGRIKHAYLFQVGADGLADFTRYLAESPEIPAYLIVDVVEEEFRRDTIPHVFGRDRKNLLLHRSRRLFRETPYWHAIFQGREEDGRRDDKVLYTALTNPGLFNPWLERLAEQKCPLVGIYSLPMLSQALLPYVAKGFSNTLLISQQATGNIRQSFFQENDLKISRLAHLPTMEPGQAATAILDEVEKLRRYLNSLRLLDRGKPMETCLLTSGPLFNELKRRCSDTGSIRFHLLDTIELCAKLGMDETLAAPCADNLFAQLLLLSQPKNHYATMEETLYHRMQKLRRSITAAGLVLAIGAAFWGGLAVVDGFLLGKRSAATQQQTDYYRVRYQRARESLPATNVEAADLEAVVESARTIAMNRSSPTALLNIISMGLDGYPELKLEKIDWEASPSMEAAQVEGAGNTEAPAFDPAKGVFHIANLQGEIAPFDGNYRRALETISAFSEMVEALDGVHKVEPVSLPLNVGPNENLTGDVHGKTGKGQARFEIRITYWKDNGKG